MGSALKVLRIAGFFGQYRFLSNFWPITIELEGIIYPSAEHIYQAHKTTATHWRKRIALTANPAQAKRLGQQAPLRPNWNTLRIPTMHQILRLKFRSAELHRKLLATGDAELLELNTWGDQYWGVIQVERQLIGQNHLGQLLMAVRRELRGDTPF